MNSTRSNITQMNTPETQAAVVASNGQWSFLLKATCERLERERDEALHKLELCMAANSDVARISRERDEAQAELEEYRSIAEKIGATKAVSERDKAVSERDEAIARRMETIMQCELYEQELAEAREQLRIAVGLLSTQPQFADKHPEDVLAFVKEGAK
jgi:hypothetical protein